MSAILEIDGLHKSFALSGGAFGKASILDALVDINLQVEKGETLAVVGESGCGKTTLGRCVLRALEPTDGRVTYHAENGEAVEISALSRRALKKWRTDIRMVFQDPMSSLNPYMRVFDIIAEPLRIHKLARGAELERRVTEALDRVGLPRDALKRFPHAFSGGQRQRIGIARALVVNPRLVIADEAVSALDVSIQAQILNLLEDLKSELGLTYIFISHDLSVVNYLADRVAVMYLGHVVEIAKTESIFDRPRHPYTEVLLDALPIPDPARRRTRETAAKGEIPFLGARPKGCPFHTRCRYAEERCRTEKPELRKVDEDGHEAACHFAETLTLNGAFAPEARKPEHA